MRAFGAVRDAAGLDHVAKQAEIGEVEAHEHAFVFDEGSLRQRPIVRQFLTAIFVSAK